MEILKNTQIIAIGIMMIVYVGIAITTRISTNKDKKIIDDMFRNYENRYQ